MEYIFSVYMFVFCQKFPKLIKLMLQKFIEKKGKNFCIHIEEYILNLIKKLGNKELLELMRFAGN